MNLDWYDIDEMTKSIAKWIEEKIGRINHHTILAVTRGGLIPGVILSHIFPSCKFQTVAIQRYEHQLEYEDTAMLAIKKFKNIKKKEPYIVIDDINDKGITLQVIREQLSHRCYFVTLVERTSSMFACDFAAKRIEHQDWVNFPWGEEG